MCVLCTFVVRIIFFCKQKTAYEMRISDWSSDVCSSDLEVNRKVAGAIADLHFAPTETAAAALRAENVPADRIHITGNTVIDALLATQARIAGEPALAAGLDPLVERFPDQRIVAVTYHRRENFGEGLEATRLRENVFEGKRFSVSGDSRECRYI